MVWEDKSVDQCRTRRTNSFSSCHCRQTPLRCAHERLPDARSGEAGRRPAWLRRLSPVPPGFILHHSPSPQLLWTETLSSCLLSHVCVKEAGVESKNMSYTRSGCKQSRRKRERFPMSDEESEKLWRISDEQLVATNTWAQLPLSFLFLIFLHGNAAFGPKRKTKF